MDPSEPAPGRPPPPPPVSAPLATRAVLVVVGVISVAALLLPRDLLFEPLRKDNAAIQAGEVWRLLTPGLVHGGLLHLAMNGLFLADLGGLVEQLFGARRMLVLLWGSVLTGSLASYWFSPPPSVGISGGLFGLVGALLAQGIRHWRRLPPEGRRMFLRGPIEIVILNVALGFAMPFIDNAAHLGGLAGGLALGAVLGFPPDVRARLEGPRRVVRGDV